MDNRDDILVPEIALPMVHALRPDVERTCHHDRDLAV